MSDQTDPWILPLRTTGEKIRLICFPYAGGGPYIFRKWSAWLPAHVGLYAVNLPGRGMRLGDAPVKQLQPIVKAVVTELHSLADRPFAFFGHSMGALLAFEVARALHRQRLAGPCLLIASGRRPPQSADPRERVHDLPDDAFLDKLKEFGGTPEEILQSKELMALLMPTLRADFSVLDNYQYEPGTPLDCPITVVSGTQDERAGGELMSDWGMQTSHMLSRHELQGAHFFIHTAEAELGRIITDDLDRWVRPNAAKSSGLGSHNEPGGNRATEMAE